MIKLKIENKDIINGRINDKIITQWSNIEHLDLFGCRSLTTLPGRLPDSLTTLDLYGCSSLNTLPSLPDSLTTLFLTHCNSLTTLPGRLPKSLITLDLSG